MVELKFLSETEPANAVGDFSRSEWATGSAISPVWWKSGRVTGVNFKKVPAPGLVLLASIMAAAALISVFILGRPADGIFPGVFFAARAAITWGGEAGWSLLRSPSDPRT
jgi:hypothetical protein